MRNAVPPKHAAGIEPHAGSMTLPELHAGAAATFVRTEGVSTAND
jgi:hypothetical protein